MMDTREECEKHGAVLSIAIPRPPAPGTGNIFVEFQTPAQAVSAAARYCAQYLPTYLPTHLPTCPLVLLRLFFIFSYF
jgi:hypothetical protein